VVLSSDASVILEKINAKSRVTPLAGTFVSYDVDGVVVDVGDGRMAAALGSGYLPGPGESVLVWFVDGIPYVMGPSTPRPHSGTVTAVGSGLATLSTAVGVFGPMPYSGSAPTVGQVMRIMWHGGPLAIAATPPEGTAAPPAPGGGQAVSHVDTFAAIETGTWNTGGGDVAGSKLNAEVWASNTTIGFWFYGTKIPDTIPASAVIQRVQLYVAARQIYGGSPVFTVHDNPTGPGDLLAGGTAVAVRNYDWIDLPVAIGNTLKRGGGGFGVGTRHGGYNIFKSLAADGQSGALRITSTY